MLLLHGDGTFQQNWFFWTGMKVYQVESAGNWILDSESYLRILLCMLVAGTLTTLKRTIISLYFGRRMFGTWSLDGRIVIGCALDLTAAACLG
jgi:hypothetical protein